MLRLTFDLRSLAEEKGLLRLSENTLPFLGLQEPHGGSSKLKWCTCTEAHLQSTEDETTVGLVLLLHRTQIYF